MTREHLCHLTRSLDAQEREPIDIRLRRLGQCSSCLSEIGPEIQTAAGTNTATREEREVRNSDAVATRRHRKLWVDLKCLDHKKPEIRNWQLRKHNSRLKITETGYRTPGPQPWTTRIHAALRGMNPTHHRSLGHKTPRSPFASSTDSRGHLSLLCAVTAQEI